MNLIDKICKMSIRIQLGQKKTHKQNKTNKNKNIRQKNLGLKK